jgi:hypothetical protein
VAQGLATDDALAEMATDFRRWADHDDAVFVAPHVECVGFV